MPPVAELYKWGDLTIQGNQSERNRLQADLAALRGASQQSNVLERLGAFLRDLPTCQDMAIPGARSAVAALIFESVEIQNDRVVAVVVEEDFVPFFAVFGQQETPTDGPGFLVARESLDPAEVTGISHVQVRLTPTTLPGP